jgi:uncharacterized protein (DUF1330 family)
LIIRQENRLMSAYIVVEVNVKDPERYEKYKNMVAPTLIPYRGRFVARGGTVEALEGDWHPARFVIIEFDSAERARAWWSSHEYAPAKKLRQETADTRMILVHGI